MDLKATLIVIMVFLFALAATGTPTENSQAQSEQVVLSIGRSFFWPTKPRTPVSVSNGAIVRTVDRGHSVKLTALKIGTSLVRNQERTLEVVVLPESSHRLYLSLQNSLKSKRGLELTINGSTIHVRGRLLRASDWEQLASAAEGHSGAYRFQASVADEVSAPVQKKILQRLKAFGLPDLSFSISHGARLSVPSEPADLKQRVQEALSPWGFQIETSSSALPLEPLIQVRIIVAELRKKLMNRMGLQWPASIEAQLLPTPRLGAAGGGPLLLGLHALEENGLGKVLASPTLLCRSGKEAQFLAGGEFPIKIANVNQHDVVWKKYGVLLKIRPRADRSGRMSIALETEVSMIDPSQVVDGIPGLLTNRIESHFDLASSRTIALSGLIKQEWGNSTAGLPGLSSLPILGALFASEEYRKQETELVVFVTPEVSSPGTESP